jgi:hypothetical protein
MFSIPTSKDLAFAIENKFKKVSQIWLSSQVPRHLGY